MKIAIISNLYPPYGRGGAERIAELSATFLAKEHEVFVITTMPFVSRESWQPSEESLDGVRVLRFCPINIFNYLDSAKHNVISRLIWNFFDIFNWHSFRVIKTILMKEKPDLVITHNLKGIGYLTPLAIKKCGIHHIHVLHDVQYAVPTGLIFWKQENNFVANGFLTHWYQAICRRLFKSVTTIISPSQWLWDYYQGINLFSKAKHYTLPNPLSSSRSEVKSIPPTKPFRLLYVGLIEYHKGIEWLLSVLIKHPEWNITIVGDGVDARRLKIKYQSSQINFVGKLTQAELQKYYRQADYLVVPSLCYENSPTVIYEAFSYGLPVIASAIGGIPELVDDNKTGFLFETESINELEKALGRVKTATNYPAISKKCLDSADQWEQSNYFKKLLSIIKEVLT